MNPDDITTSADDLAAAEAAQDADPTQPPTTGESSGEDRSGQTGG